MKFIKRLFCAVTAMVVSLCCVHMITENSNSTVNADEVCSVGLEMTADKTWFSLDEVRAGTASAKLYVDVTTEFDTTAEVLAVGFGLKPNVWGVIDPINILISDPNKIVTKKGNGPSSGAYNPVATQTNSIWNKEVPEKPRYTICNLADSISEYADENIPSALISTDSTKGNLYTDSANGSNHIVECDIIIPADAKPGKYTIDFADAHIVAGQTADCNNKKVSVTDTKPISITIGELNIENSACDVNNDSYVDVADIVSLQEFLLGISDNSVKNADVNNDTVVNVLDMILIKRAVLNS